ncbi:MAG: hypothetical protein ABIO46_10100 [Chitinophagales bacterium]
MKKNILPSLFTGFNIRLLNKILPVAIVFIGQVSSSFSQDSTAAKCSGKIELTISYRINNEAAFNLLDGFYGTFGGSEIDDVNDDVWILMEDSVTFYLHGESEIYTNNDFPYYNAIRTIDTNLVLIEDTVTYYYEMYCPEWTQIIIGYPDKAVTQLVFETFFLSHLKIIIHRRSDFGMNVPLQTHLPYTVEGALANGGLMEGVIVQYEPYNFEVYNLNGQVINSGIFDYKLKQVEIEKIESKLPVPGIFIIRIYGEVFNERIKVLKF